MSTSHPRCAASSMPNNLQRPYCCTPRRASSLPAAPLKVKEGAVPCQTGQTHTITTSSHKSGVRSKPHERRAVLNSAAAALHASDETVVQTAEGTQYSRGHNPHDIRFTPFPPYRRASQDDYSRWGNYGGFVQVQM